MRQLSALQLVGLALLMTSTMGKCILKSNCTTDDDPNCMPYITNYTDPVDSAPTQWEFPDDLKGLCPDYENKPNCCNSFTMQILKSKFMALDPTFGHPAIGCSICGANLKRFWCKYNCDANQEDFMVPGSSQYVDYQKSPDPTDIIRVVKTDIVLNIETTCPIYESCKSVDFAKALGSMSNYQGFFNTMSSQAITLGNVLMNFTYAGGNQTGLKIPVNNCSMVFKSNFDQYNYTLYGDQPWCNCQHCSYNCTGTMDFSQYIKHHGVLDGMNAETIKKSAIVAAIILVLGLLLRFTVFSSSGSGKDEEEALEEGRPGYFASRA